jgi:ribosome biogenesis GTPase
VGVEAVRELLAPGVTGALIGSSGVGKSTIVNALLERDAQPVAEVRASDSRGRHTTTRRELFLLPGGGLLLDQPGLREIQLWDGSGVGAAFPDIAEHAAGCRFRDCTHTVEPGCQVRMNIDEARVANFLKMTTEADAVARKRRDKVIHRAINRMKRHGKR